MTANILFDSSLQITIFAETSNKYCLIDIENIIAGCKNDNRSSQKVLYERYSRIIYTICYRYFGNSYDAKDATHDSFLKVLDKIKSFKGEGSFEGWLKKIVTNHCIDSLKKKNKNIFVQVDDFSVSDSIDENDSITELEQIVLSKSEIEGMVNKLPEKYRLIVNLHIVDNLSHEDISFKIGISISNSKVRLNRARKLLLDEYQNIIKTVRNITAI